MRQEPAGKTHFRRFGFASIATGVFVIAVFGVTVGVSFSRIFEEPFMTTHVELVSPIAAALLEAEVPSAEYLRNWKVPEAQRRLKHVVEMLQTFPEVARVSIFNDQGVLVFSNIRQNQVGTRHEAEDVAEVFDSRATLIKKAGKATAAQIGKPDLLEIYQPVFFGGAVPGGIVEVYFDRASVMEDVRLVQWYVGGISALVAFCVALLLFFVVRGLHGRYTKDLERQVKEQTAALATANDKINAAIEAMVHGLVVIETDRRISLANRTARLILNADGAKLPEFTELRDRLKGRVDLEKLVDSCFLGGVPIEGGSVIMHDRNYEVGCMPVRDVHDQVMSALVVFKDVTLEKELERIRREFTAVLVHELRAPLTNARWTVEAVLESLDDAAHGDAMEQLSGVLGSVNAMRGLVNDILDLSKIEAGKFQITLKEGDLSALIAEKIKEFRPQAEHKGLALSAGKGQPAPRFSFDDVRIGQALSNLLSNALKFTEKGSVTVATAYDAARKTVRVSVVDSGIGIPIAQRQRLFQKYIQLGESKDKKKGTGLGLAIVKGIVETHGGAVGVESEEGRGSTFWFELPLK